MRKRMLSLNLNHVADWELEAAKQTMVVNTGWSYHFHADLQNEGRVSMIV
jgi:hypothetical protein